MDFATTIIKDAIITRHVVQGQDVDFFEVNGMFLFQLVNAPGHWGQLSRSMSRDIQQCKSRAERHIEQYYLSQSSD